MVFEGNKSPSVGNKVSEPVNHPFIYSFEWSRVEQPNPFYLSLIIYTVLLTVGVGEQPAERHPTKRKSITRKQSI